MRRVLIVSPHFPPVNAPDMQRVRLSLPYFSAFGWEAHVLAVAPDSTVQALESRLVETVSSTVPVTRVRALPAGLTAWFGLRNLGWRAWAALFFAGSRLLRTGRFDVVYFSTTQFICLPMGRIWRRLFGVPYVIDLQDPWLNDYYFDNPNAARPGGAKYLLAHASAWLLEAWTLRRCAGLISVSATYPQVLQRRYPWLRDLPITVIPFGFDERDFELLRKSPAKQNLFSPADGCAHVVSIGRGGDDLLKAVGALFTSLSALNRRDPTMSARLRVHFAGTNYAAAGRAQPMFIEVARRHGVAAQYEERPWRLGYFEALQCQLDADAVLVLGSDDASYSPSKLYSVLLTGRPVVAFVLAGSLLETLIPATPGVHKITFDRSGNVISGLPELLDFWRKLVTAPESRGSLLSLVANAPPIALHARTLTQAQISFLDSVVGASVGETSNV